MKTPTGLALLMPKPDEAPPEDYLHTAASDLIAAVKAADARAVKHALRAAFMALEAEPHKEGPQE